MILCFWFKNLNLQISKGQLFFLSTENKISTFSSIEIFLNSKIHGIYNKLLHIYHMPSLLRDPIGKSFDPVWLVGCFEEAAGGLRVGSPKPFGGSRGLSQCWKQVGLLGVYKDILHAYFDSLWNYQYRIQYISHKKGNRHFTPVPIAQMGHYCGILT